jgi:anti-anti-sigma factor
MIRAKTISGQAVNGEEAEVADGDHLQIGPLRFTFAVHERDADKAAQMEAEVAHWLLDGSDTDHSASTLLVRKTLSADEPAAPAPESSPSAREIRLSASHLGYEVVLGVLVVRIHTPVLADENGIAPIRRELLSLFEAPLPRRVVVSLEHVTFLSSRAVGVLLAHFQRIERSGGVMRLCHVPSKLLPILEQMRLPTLIDIFPTIDEAVVSTWE